jgi:hypothetical protein
MGSLGETDNDWDVVVVGGGFCGSHIQIYFHLPAISAYSLIQDAGR